MDAAVRNRIYVESTRMNIHDIVRQLNIKLGTTVVQSMAGVRDRSSPTKWAKADGPEPRADVETRLRLGYRVFRTLEQADGESLALAWLMGANPRLAEELPVLFIQKNLARDVMGAAEAFVNDTFAA